MGTSGGFTFLIVYLILAVLCGFIVMGGVSGGIEKGCSVGMPALFVMLLIIMDTLVALMAGLCVIPGRFALDPTGTLGGPIFGILFYLLVVFAAISSSISLLEAVVAHFVDKARDAGKGDKRKSPPPFGAAGFFLSPMHCAAPV